MALLNYILIEEWVLPRLQHPIFCSISKYFFFWKKVLNFYPVRFVSVVEFKSLHYLLINNPTYPANYQNKVLIDQNSLSLLRKKFG